jgi:hypothetical protein
VIVHAPVRTAVVRRLLQAQQLAPLKTSPRMQVLAASIGVLSITD